MRVPWCMSCCAEYVFLLAHDVLCIDLMRCLGLDDASGVCVGFVVHVLCVFVSVCRCLCVFP